ncbi:thiol oxidoreductase [Pikeienuella piscinae]|uniref:Thiol oxidoreductase n=1 Tax=Pikeienuella piscinae TaxID=2748098 RepID=A0A7L5BXW4_9RHOB|nr:di-heme oxidoredictase family protein [Pikeienuella piscinae]QIE54734.1 thiol oxidoreductase [Pikeienuella piscinae]
MHRPPRGIVILASFVVAASIAAPLAGGERAYLHIVPRTDAERARIEAVTRPTSDFSGPERFERLPAGAATSQKRLNADAYSHFSPSMPFARELDFKVGNGLFRKLWVSAPSSTLASDGLGPLFNARACQHCHLKDGRGHPPDAAAGDAVSFALKISVPVERAALRAELASYLDYAPTAPHPVYGGQVQDLGIQGQAAEGRVEVGYEEIEVPLSGGEVAHLRRPTYNVADPAYGPLGAAAALSPRVAPQMIGLGLLEAIPEADILAWADPDDSDGDGISGKPQIAWSTEWNAVRVGRFGYKAGKATIREQAAAAFAADLGISTPLHPEGWGDCTAAQTRCRKAPHGGDARDDGFEIGEEGLELVTFYSRNLAVPARRDVDDPEVLRGKRVFYETGCAACHRPKFVTDRLVDQPAQSFQLIWPYTDLLLHDMGEGLADGYPEGRATGREWRTAPLWGVGLTRTVNGHEYFLHDGRARGFLEAILWHGGEAQTARDAVTTMPKADRAALIRFLESL